LEIFILNSSHFLNPTKTGLVEYLVLFQLKLSRFKACII